MPENLPASPRIGAPVLIDSAHMEAWLANLEIGPIGRAERDRVVSWDLVLDGRRRRDLRVTLILDPDLGVICWAQLAPPILDGLRKAYRTLLGWNDEFPFAKFSISEDGRPSLSVELETGRVDVDAIGLALTRLCGIADALFEQTARWLWIGGRPPAGYLERPCRNIGLLDRHAGRLPELFPL